MSQEAIQESDLNKDPLKMETTLVKEELDIEETVESTGHVKVEIFVKQEPIEIEISPRHVNTDVCIKEEPWDSVGEAGGGSLGEDGQVLGSESVQHPNVPMVNATSFGEATTFSEELKRSYTDIMSKNGHSSWDTIDSQMMFQISSLSTHMHEKTISRRKFKSRKKKKKVTGTNNDPTEKEEKCICHQCNKEFSKKKYLIYHIRYYGERTHLKDKVEKVKQHTCKFCQKKFLYLNKLIIHERSHTGERPYVCTTCGQSYKQKFQLASHTRLHTGENPRVCGTCGKHFVTRADLVRHELVHSKHKPFACDICEQQFTQKAHLSNHRLIHTGEKQNRKKHQLTHRDDPLNSEVCNEQFSVETDLKQQAAHSEDKFAMKERVFPCETCQKVFISNSDLLRHQRIHTGTKPYSCDVCDKKFSQLAHLKSHRRIHTGDKPYSCDICHKQFATKGYLYNHKRIHKGDISYTCELCNKQFKHKGRLKQHENKHARENAEAS